MIRRLVRSVLWGVTIAFLALALEIEITWSLLVLVFGSSLIGDALHALMPCEGD